MTTDIIRNGLEVVRIELEAVQQLHERIDTHFAQAVELIAASRGRVIFTGMGKSGLVAKKIAATMTSVGTVALFLHPAEGIHGDLGLVSAEDVIIAISKSGETVELNRLIPVFRRYGCKIIALTGNPKSELARYANITLDISVPKEACPFDLAPTSSTTITLILGDALAIALLKLKNFQLEDFARNHPGGSIGRSLLKVSDIMRRGAEVPIVPENALMRDVLPEMTAKRLGMTAVIDPAGQLCGIITDGDLRRWLSHSRDPLNEPAGVVMIRQPKTISADRLAVEAVELMEHHNITSLVILDGIRHPIGVIHLHDLIKSGIAYQGKGHTD